MFNLPNLTPIESAKLANCDEAFYYLEYKATQQYEEYKRNKSLN